MKHKNISTKNHQKPGSTSAEKSTLPAKESSPATPPSPNRPCPMGPIAASPQALERAARLFFALGDPARLRLLVVLVDGEHCVGELVNALGEKFSTVSQRLRLLRAEGLVKRRRSGNHLHYGLADNHVLALLRNALEHSAELSRENSPGGGTLHDTVG